MKCFVYYNKEASLNSLDEHIAVFYSNCSGIDTYFAYGLLHERFFLSHRFGAATADGRGRALRRI